MALPENQVGTFTPAEICFLAEHTKVTIIPRQSLDAIDILGGEIPAMRAMRRKEVPLWVAVALKKQSRCNIVSPDWLTEDALKATYEAEAADMARFSGRLPWEWMETGEMMLAYASDDLSSPPHVIRNLLRDIKEVRQAKVRAGLRSINEYYLQMDNAGAMELNEIRPFLTLAMNKLRKLHQTRLPHSAGPEEDPASESDDDSPEADSLEREGSYGQNGSGPRVYSRARQPQTYADDDDDDDGDMEVDESYLKANTSK